MANQLKMAKIQAILELHQQGWSQRRIARALVIDRETVSRHVQRAAEDSKAAISPAARLAIARSVIPSGGLHRLSDNPHSSKHSAAQKGEGGKFQSADRAEKRGL